MKKAVKKTRTQQGVQLGFLSQFVTPPAASVWTLFGWFFGLLALLYVLAYSSMGKWLSALLALAAVFSVFPPLYWRFVFPRAQLLVWQRSLVFLVFMVVAAILGS